MDTTNIVIEILKHNGHKLRAIPAHMITPGVIEYIQSENMDLDILAYLDIPKELITQSMFIRAMKENPFNKYEVFEHTPEDALTYVLCKDAVSQCPYNIYNVPGKYKTKYLCFYAMKKIWGNRDVWRYRHDPIPKELLNEDNWTEEK